MPDPNTTESLISPRQWRDGLYHVSLPEFRKDPLWANMMESATQAAVQIMKEGVGNKDVLLNSERNLSMLIRRLVKTVGLDKQDILLQAIQGKVEEFISHPTLRDIADYVLADAQYNYHIENPEFKSITNELGVTARTICNYGTPRELEPTFDTPFSGKYQVNPYKDYDKRARECKDKYSDTKRCMHAQLTKLVISPQGDYNFDETNNDEVTLTKTTNSSWWHTDVSNFDKIWNHINTLYGDLSTLVSTDTQNLLAEAKTLLISQIGWWYFQAMPYTRGSSAAGISLIQSLFDYSGIKNSPYKDGVAPDLEALVTPLPMYSKNFVGFFQQALEPIKDTSSGLNT